MKSAIFTIFFSLSLLQTCWSQINTIDQVKMEQHMDYLHRKLNYTYYNPDLQNWWINKFDYEKDKQLIHVKNTQVKNPNKITGKKYIEKTFRLSDINPYTIEKVHLDHSEGRAVKGEEIKLFTVKHKKLIRRTINGQKGSAQSFLHISIPSYMEDSAHIADSVILALKESIYFSTKLHRSEDHLENKEIIFETLMGDHEFQSGDGKVKRFMKSYAPFLIAYEEYKDRKKLRDGFFGYDPENDHFYEIIIEQDGRKQSYEYKMSQGDELILSTEDGNRKIFFENKSLYYYEIGGTRIDMETS